MSVAIEYPHVKDALRRAGDALVAARERLTDLDQALGDGDLGVTAEKVGSVLQELPDETPNDLGRFLIDLGMRVNRAAPSTMGTLIATGFLRAGKSLAGKSALAPDDLAAALEAADEGVRQRGKAQPGDKTVVDALHPAAETLRARLDEGDDLEHALHAALAAAQEGRDRVTPLRSRIGRAGWVGERTEGAVDPGCELFVTALAAVVKGEDA